VLVRFGVTGNPAFILYTHPEERSTIYTPVASNFISRGSWYSSSQLIPLVDYSTTFLSSAEVIQPRTTGPLKTMNCKYKVFCRDVIGGFSTLFSWIIESNLRMGDTSASESSDIFLESRF
jgi:hypothetical protein